MNIETSHARLGEMQVGLVDGVETVVTIHPSGVSKSAFVIEVHTCEYSVMCTTDAVTIVKLIPVCGKHAQTLSVDRLPPEQS